MRIRATFVPLMAALAVACSGQAPVQHALALLPGAGVERSPLEGASVRSVQLLAASAIARLSSLLDSPPNAGAPRPPSPVADLPPPDPPAAPAPESHWLGALAKEVVVFAEPSAKARRLGYLRSGARVLRSAEPASRAGCRGGWYRIAPEGYVCAGSRATLDLDHPLLQLALAQPSRDDGLPYAYGRARIAAPPVYRSVSVPSAGGPTALGPWRGVALLPVPELLRSASEVEPASHSSVAKSAFAFVSFVEAGGIAYGVTTDLELVPLHAVTPVTPSRFHGLVLDDDASLPVGFVTRRHTRLYRGDPGSGLEPARALERRELVMLGAREIRASGVTLRETRDGGWLRKDAVRIVERRPGGEQRTGKWIDVSLVDQTLVAYEGDRPVFVTLVSTGEGGTGDPETTRATVQGRFRIHTKHVTATMDSDEPDDPYDQRDVPYVQYFTEGYALHAAHWHDGFGTPRSHGCINLSPSDARFLFHWTDPPVPQGWHTALSVARGTLIEIHP